MRVIALLLVALVGFAVPGGAVWSYGPDSFNCKMRLLAYQYGQKTLPRFAKFENLYNALGLNVDCDSDQPTRPVFTDADREPAPVTYPSPAQPGAKTYFVDYAKGSDSNDGSISAPFKTVAHAVSVSTGSETINLRAGTHYFSETVAITEKNNGLTIQNYNGEAVTVSGGRKVSPQWSAYPLPNANGSNAYRADLSGQGFTNANFPGFQVNGVRATRARFPNGNVELPERSQEAGDPNGVQMIPGDHATWTPPDSSKQGTQTYVTNTNPAEMRNFSTGNLFNVYAVGIGGPCAIYDPPVAYWCAESVSGGGATAFQVPQGVTPVAAAIAPAGGGPDAGLHMPWKNPSQAIYNVWRPSRWENWMFENGNYDAATNNVTFGFGGFQGARGNAKGGDFFVENIFEEFDYPNEFFFNEADSHLYFYYNASGAPPADAEYVVPQVATLFNLTSSRWNPIKDVTIRGLKLTAARYTYMELHGVVSGGDWALDRWGAVFLQGTERVKVEGCHFTRLDGNGVMVSGYNRNATISGNEFSWMGGNGVAAWGFTNDTGANPLEGFDGTDGNHPRFTTVVNNLIREVGHYEKQSSFYIQGKVAESILLNNVFFNGPRAGINFNDGFGGGDLLGGNLVFSACRESGDHGPFNSWDRQPFLTSTRTGQPSVQMQWRELRNNFFIDNYNIQEDIDNDDGSAYYHTHDNFLVSGGGGMKNDFGGHDNWQYNNVYAYVQKGFGICKQIAGHEDAYFNSSLIMTGEEVGSGEGCSGPGMTLVHDLTIYTPTGNATECNQSPPQSNGTTVHVLPSDDFIIALGKAKLVM